MHRTNPTLATTLRAVLLVLAGLLQTAAHAQLASPGKLTAVVTTEQVRAELMAHAPDGAGAGSTVWLGLQLAHQKGWHTYWKNPGDSGLPTELAWTLPPGVSAGDIAWPAPHKIPIGTLANYGYEDTVLLPVPLTISPEFKPSLFSGEMVLRLKASWLVCKQECIPQDGNFEIRLPLKSSVASNRGAFEAAWRAAPVPLDKSTGAQAVVQGNSLEFTVPGMPATLQGKTLAMFPETIELVHTAATPTQRWDGTVWHASVPLSAQRISSPTMVPLVLVFAGNAVRAELPVSGSWPAVASGTAAVLTAPQPGLARAAIDPGPSLTLWTALLGALLGGLILNLMPCVFPILAIKVLGFTRHASDRRAHRASGLAYTAGVVLSFMALGALMLGLRGASEALGWGFQLQDPAFVATLAVLFTLIGLNLSGLYGVASVLPSSLASLQLRHPAADAFLTGVLAVVVASPCTAPFMGASIGFAVALPAAEALAIFASMGLGLALPYLVASLVPAFARMLPRPGAWMDTFKKFLAFPMYATVAWLVWVLGQQSGIDGAGALLALLVAVALLVWALTLAGTARAALGGVALLGLAALLWGVGPYVTRPLETPMASRTDGWQAWEPGRVEQVLASGQPVFVDFTAAWCITCQYNKKTTLGDPQVLADLAAKKVVLLRADWTRRDPAITAALQQHGRSGVPLYVLYQPGRAPVLLSEILTVQDMRSALGRL